MKIPGQHFLKADEERKSANIHSFVQCNSGKMINEIYHD